MSRTSWSWTTERSFPSDTQATPAAVADLLVYLEQQGWPERDIFGIHMAVEEALVNAIQHGNCEDATKRVHVLYRATPTKLRIEISDEGPGFKSTAVADPTDQDHLDKPHGRGLLLMRAYMNKVEYLGRGNTVVMEKRRSRRKNAA